jgi:hypothetical protein
VVFPNTNRIGCPVTYSLSDENGVDLADDPFNGVITFSEKSYEYLDYNGKCQLNLLDDSNLGTETSVSSR